MKQFNFMIFVCIQVVLFQACQLNSEESQIIPTDCVGKYPNVFESSRYQDFVLQAIESANYILAEDIPFQLVPAWDRDSTPMDISIDEVPVHIVEVERPGLFGIAFIPKGEKCILIDASLVTNALYTYSGRAAESSQDYEETQSVILNYILLHEAGHINFDYYGDKENLREVGERLCQSELFDSLDLTSHLNKNNSCDETKMLEIIADKFAEDQIQDALNPNNGSMRYLNANLTLLILHSAAIQIVLASVEDEEGNNDLRDACADSGYSHPNTELRILIMLSAINPDMQWLLDECKDKRVGKFEENEVDFSNTPTVELIEILIDQNGDLYERIEAATILGERKSVQAVEHLLQILDEPNIFTGQLASKFRSFKVAVIGALGEIGDLKAVQPLLELVVIENIVIQMAAAEALGRLGDSAAVPTLIPFIDPNNNNRMMQVSSIIALGEIKDRQAVDPLIVVLLNEDAPSLAQKEAAIALAKIGDSRAIVPLEELLEVGVGKETEDIFKEALINLDDFKEN